VMSAAMTGEANDAAAMTIAAIRDFEFFICYLAKNSRVLQPWLSRIGELHAIKATI
jgi:hypothetical protein